MPNVEHDHTDKDKAADKVSGKAAEKPADSDKSVGSSIAGKVAPISKSDSDWLRSQSFSHSLDLSLGFASPQIFDSGAKDKATDQKSSTSDGKDRAVDAKTNTSKDKAADGHGNASDGKDKASEVKSGTGEGKDKAVSYTGSAADKAVEKTSAKDSLSEQAKGDTPEAKLKKDWVVTLDLTVHLGTDTPEAQQARLAALAKSTEHKSVAIVVQDVAASSDGSGGKELHRYIIADGVIKQLPTEPSKGFAADAGSLVAKANELVEAKKTAFIEVGHGAGNGGFLGDNGGAGVQELADALKAGNGGKPLNDVVLDSCLVAQDGAIKALAGAAKDGVVASAELGGNADDSIRGMNYEKTLEKLIADPSMDGKAFAKQFVQDARDGADKYVNSKGELEAGVRDLSAFDPGKVADFEKALGKLGKTLKGLESTPGNRAVLQKIISDTYKYDFAHSSPQQRDLSMFAKSVQDAIAKGELKDPDHKAAEAAKAVLAAQKAMTVDTYGEKGPRTDFASLGGVSVLLPSSEHIHQDGPNTGFISMMQFKVKEAIDGKGQDDNEGKSLHTAVKFLEKRLHEHPKFAAKLTGLERLSEKVEQSGSGAAYKQALEAFQNGLKALAADQSFMKALKQLMPIPEEQDLSVSGNAGWSSFVKSLYSDRMYTA